MENQGLFNMLLCHSIHEMLSENFAYLLLLGMLTRPLVMHAGEDISHWFDPETEDVRAFSISSTMESQPTHSLPLLPLTLDQAPHRPGAQHISPVPALRPLSSRRASRANWQLEDVGLPAVVERSQVHRGQTDAEGALG